MRDFRNTVYFPYYGHLSLPKRGLYEELLQGYLACAAKISVAVPAVVPDVSEVIEAICCDHPEIFWMSQKAVITHNTASGAVMAVTPTYLFDIRTIPHMKQQFQAAVRRYLAAAAGKKPLEQERLIHDKLANEVSYVHSAYDQSAYGALVCGKAVCAGYTRAFQLLMQEIGIPCFYCFGDGKNMQRGSWESHAWNILKLGTEYYNMDLTWDDCYENTKTDKISYTYYNCDDRSIASNHRRSAKCSFLPACRGTKYSYQGITGVSPELEAVYQDGVTCRQIVRSANDFWQFILPVIVRSKGSATSVSFPAEGRANFGLLKDAITAVLKEELSDTLYNISYRYTDFKNGWYRIRIDIAYDDPLKRICAEGVTHRKVVRSINDFERYILPEICRCTGRTLVILFPAEIPGDFAAFQQSMSSSIRSHLTGRSCSWTGTWQHYCGKWYRMQYQIEYKK